MLSYKLKLKDVYCKIGTETIDLISKFNREIIKNLNIKYFCMDMEVNNKMYYVKNIPIALLDMGDYNLSRYISRQIVEYNIPKGIFDYEEFLLE